MQVKIIDKSDFSFEQIGLPKEHMIVIMLLREQFIQHESLTEFINGFQIISIADIFDFNRHNLATASPIPPSEGISQLLLQRFNAINLFKSCNILKHEPRFLRILKWNDKRIWIEMKPGLGDSGPDKDIYVFSVFFFNCCFCFVFRRINVSSYNCREK
jgi:hypothetical protein